MNIMQLPALYFPYGKVPGPHAQIVRLFLVFTYIKQEDVAKIP